MTPQELSICREIHAGLTSNERGNINYLFLSPVDTTHFPDYPVIIKRPMDLQTLKEHLENGTYAKKEEFYADAKLIFDNALLFNKGRDSKFVLDLAKSMIKAFDRVRKSAEKKAARLAAAADGGSVGNQKASKEGGKKKKINIKLKKQKSTSSIGELPKAAPSDSTGAGDVSTKNDSKPTKKVKTKLKLKLSTGSSDAKKGASKVKVKSSTPKSDSAAEKVEVVPMNSFRRAQCVKIIASLKRRQPGACKWFHKPVSDPAIVQDYKEKISNPMDLSMVSSKLDKNQYSALGDFVQDLRLIAANCLQYNTSPGGDSFRPVAMEFLTTAEDLCRLFIAKHEAPTIVYPTLLYCWVDCIKAVDELINMTNPEDGLQTAWYFLHPVTYFCGGQYPEGYLEKVKRPIDLGTIVQQLMAGHYNSVGAFVADCRRIVENCRAFYAGDEEGASLCEKANRLHGSMEKNLDPLIDFDQSDKGAKAKERAAPKYIVIKRPEKDFLKNIMRELRAAKYTDKSTRLTENATLHFEKPVDTAIFTDYLKFVETPMDLETVDSKIESGSYVTPEDFEYDISLIFKNCLDYNGPKKNIHMVTLGKHTAKIFRKLFAEKLRGGSVAKRLSLPTAANRVAPATLGGKVGGKKRPASPVPEERPSKRVSIKGPLRTASKAVSTSSSGKSAPKSKPGKKIAKSPTKITPTDPSVPIPMHVAIASIKESYPGRRQNKDLEGWEADCLKFLRQLMKHPWVSAERPKYIFHVPVFSVFPEIRDIYAQKVETPMDLTTAEAKLLSGVYPDAEVFISDIALVFSNAITFNKEGHDVGEPMSCAYYEASTHLLKYIRWLSLELIESSLIDCSDSPVVESGSASSWKLTIRNREMARKEMESTVFNELLDKTEPGDKFSWSEQECEKLLKSLRHTSDNKRMGFFVQMNFPPDYTAFISKPIAWEKCQEKLQQRRYNNIGETVADLRLIFSNALKYNEGARHVSKISGIAYDSAIHMSRKLESAIDKMLLSFGDRIGRERIDMITSHREMEATERAEEEQRKQEWEKENPGSTVEVKTKLRIVHQRSSHRKKMTDFEFPFYDEQDNQVETQADSLQHAKALYEKQREARANMQEIALSIGISVFKRHQESAAAKAWAYQMAYKAHTKRISIEKERAEAKKEARADEAPGKPMGAFVSLALNDNKRKKIKMSMSIQKTKKIRRSKVVGF
eukprot:CAMPEP_0172316206 /NCGR_PEP_ID=MMETSP1058-20130122/27507_1 /TAXON_ID=83371 /ORGANISM="Detonula confervacea, Strain CCMP 353" /LENGTH=1200 /DNA_ID=CAMNT_0013030463 /DNA_START=35 /DNA_END=3637 /DNA_ORIENTATION=+